MESTLTIPQGTTFTVYWDLIDTATGALITNTTGFTARCQIRPMPGSDTVLFTFPPGVFSANHRVTFTATDVDTGGLDFYVAAYDVLVTDASGASVRIGHGPVVLTHATTQPAS